MRKNQVVFGGFGGRRACEAFFEWDNVLVFN
jgi:hypothetical protein